MTQTFWKTLFTAKMLAVSKLFHHNNIPSQQSCLHLTNSLKKKMLHFIKNENFNWFPGVKILWKLCGNCAFPQNFYSRKLGKITVFYTVCFYLTHFLTTTFPKITLQILFYVNWFRHTSISLQLHFCLNLTEFNCCANQLTGFYRMATSVFNELINAHKTKCTRNCNNVVWI